MFDAKSNEFGVISDLGVGGQTDKFAGWAVSAVSILVGSRFRQEVHQYK